MESKLPIEVLSKILSYIPQKERVDKRRINKEWRSLIDNFSTFRVSYNSIPPELLDHVLSLRIRAIQFNKLSHPLHLPTHPHSIKEITLGPHLSPTQTQKILTHLNKIETLRYFVTEKSDTAFSSSHRTYYLQNLHHLKSLELGLLTFQPIRDKKTCISAIFKETTFSSLSELHLHLELSKPEWDTIKLFIQRHEIRVFGSYLQCVCDYTPFSNTSSITILQKNCACAGESLWNLLISSRKIQKIHTDLVPSVECIYQLAATNHNLTNLTLIDVCLGVEAHMDCSLLRDCVCLQSLSLHFRGVSVIVLNCGVDMIRFPECSGLGFLPKSLRCLSIKGCDILEEECMGIGGLRDLVELSLVGEGGRGCDKFGFSLGRFLGLLGGLRNLVRCRVGGGWVKGGGEEFWEFCGGEERVRLIERLRGI